MKNSLVQVVIAVALAALLILLTDPFMLIMPDMLGMAVLLCASVLLCLWAGLVMQEKVNDEREAFHRMNAGRIAYLLGIGVLSTALVVQGLSHSIDPWIALALGVMIIGKLIVRLYIDRFQ